MKITQYFIFILVASWASATVVGADLKTTNIVVVGTRTASEIQNIAADITVITAEEIEKSAASSLIEVLRGVASIQVSDNATNVTLSIRGFSAEQAGSNTLILLNGRRLNNSDLAAPQLSSISIAEILRIEVLNSSAGVLYGDQAVAGVINIITKQNQSSFTQLTATVASFDSNTISFATSIDLNQNWSLDYVANKKNTDNFRQHNEESLQQQHLALNYQTDNMGFIIAVDSTDQKINTPGALLSADLLIGRDFSRTEFSADFLNYDTTNYRLSNFIRITDDWLFEFELQNNQDDNRSLTSFINFQSTFKSTTTRELLSFTPRISHQYQAEKGIGKFTAGVDVIESDYSFSLLGRSNSQKSISGYLHISHPFVENLSINGGARYAKVRDQLVDVFSYANGVNLENDASAINLGLVYQWSDKIKMFASTEQNFRFAKVDEQAYTSPGVIGLDPQLGVSIDFGLTAAIDDTQIKFAVYQLKLKHEINFDSAALPPIGALFQGANVNADKSIRQGVTMNINHSYSKSLQLGLNAVWNDARFSSGLNRNHKIPGVAKNLYRLDLNFDIKDSSSLNLEYIYTGKRKQEGDNGDFYEQLKSYSLINLGFLYNFTGKLSHWRFSARINNLLDKDYINFAQFNGFYPAAGLNASASIHYRIDN